MDAKRNTPLNPFILSGYHSEGYFCNRKNETKRALSALKNGRNITLMSMRRMGKTGLIQHLFNPVISEQKFKTVYLDIYSTNNISDFVKILSKAVLESLESKTDKILQQSLSFFRSIRPVISFNSQTGIPEIEISSINEQKPTESLNEIFSYLEAQDELIVVAIDEFQQIAYYPEKNIEALLRTHIQKLTHVRFVFAGSEKHLLQNMFTSSNRPFYLSSELLYLEAIEREDYVNFAIDKFQNAGKDIDVKLIDSIYEQLWGHTWYVQFLMNRIFALPQNLITKEDVEAELTQVILENEPIFHSFRKMLTSFQWQLLLAVAKEKKVKHITGKSFINTYNLGTSSSVQTGIKSLIDKELVFELQGFHFVYDRFLSLWMERQ